MDSGRERLFILTLCFSLAMTLVFAGALVYDITSNRDSAATSTVIHTGGAASGDAGATDQAGTPAPSASGGVAGPVGSNSARPSARAGAAPVAPAASDVIPPGSTITIGALITQSGPVDASDAFRADEAYVQMINAQGGINGHKLALDVKDDQGNPAVGRPAFEQIVQEDHALALVGECGPVTDATIVNEINQLQVPVVNDCLTSDDAYRSPYIYFNSIAPDYWQAISARYIYKHQDQMKMHKPYVLCVQSSVTLAYCDGFVNEWARLGGTTCSHGKCAGGHDDEQIATPRASYETVCANIRSSGADSIVALLEPTNEAAFLQALHDQNMSPQAWPQFAPLGMDPSSIRTVGSFANGVYVDTQDSYYASENTPAMQQLRDALARYSPDTPVDNYSKDIGWEPMVLFGEALRRMGNNISRQNLLATLSSMTGFDNGLSKPMQWSPTNRNAPPFTRWARISGPASWDVFTGWIDQNGDPSP